MSIISGLKKHNEKEIISFHMPGHKMGKGFENSVIASEIWKYDTTELSDTDCLQKPTEFIKEAEEYAAKIYGAKNSFFIVNGSTGGILSMFFACFKEGDKVIISRDCHKSVVNAMIFTGVIPIYIEPRKNEMELYGGINPEDVEDIFKKNKDLKGLFLTSPSYFGIMSDIKKLSEIAHKYNALLLCDEAHGAHFPFSEKFPISAVKAGADLSVVSMHKTMLSPNQTAVLNVGHCEISEKKVRDSINMFQTTSPSYVFLAAIEEALLFGEKNGRKLTEKLIKQIPQNEHIYFFDDPFKIVLNFSDKGFDGNYVLDILEKKYGIFCEMAQGNNVLLMISWANTKEDFDVLKKAIEYLESLPDMINEEIENDVVVSYNENCIYTPREVAMKEKEAVLPDLAEGRIAGCEVTSFPPCIPYFMPGERITRHNIDLIKKSIANGNCMTGIENGKIFVIKE